MRKNLDPFSLAAQLLRVPRPSVLEIARDREREKARKKRITAEYRALNRERMRILRSKT
jgi:hypothetical protein